MTQFSNGTLEARDVTMDDVARALGLTKATVSCALSGKGRVAAGTRETVLAKAQEMGFRPNPQALQLTQGRATNTIGLFALGFDLGVATSKLQFLQMLLAEQGYRAPIHICGLHYRNDASAQADILADLRRQRPMGLICNTISIHPQVLREVELFKQQGGHAVCYDSAVDCDCDQVLFDREHNAYTATRHLLELGHRKIGLYANWGTPNPSRLKGYRRALQEFGVATRGDWVLPGEEAEGTVPLLSNIAEANGARLAENFLALDDRPTAMVVTNDAMASAFVSALMRLGLRVPHDVSVVGQDNLPVGEFTSPVPLTTVSQPVQLIAERVVAFLMDRIRGEYQGPARTVTLRGEFIERQSTAPWHGAA